MVPVVVVTVVVWAVSRMGPSRGIDTGRTVDCSGTMDPMALVAIMRMMRAGPNTKRIHCSQKQEQARPQKDEEGMAESRH